jgi:PAS domain S-box-containing protein
MMTLLCTLLAGLGWLIFDRASGVPLAEVTWTRVLGLLALWGTAAIVWPLLKAQTQLVATDRVLRQQAQAHQHQMAQADLVQTARQSEVEQALRDSEALYHSLVDHLPLSVLRKDAAFTYTFVNRRFLEFSGKQASEILGKTDFDLFPQELAQKYRQGDEQVFATGQLFKDVEEYRQPDGSVLYIEVLKTPVRDAQQKIIGTQVMFADVTRRKRAEEALAGSRAELEERNAELQRSQQELRNQTDLLESILQSIADGVVVADESGKFMLWNAAAERIIGLGATDSTAAQWSEVYGLYRLDRVTPYPGEELPLARAIRGEDVRDAELVIRNRFRPRGVVVSVNGTPLRDQNGRLRGGVVIFRDVTSQNEAEEALRLSEERSRQIIGTAFDPFISIDAAGVVIEWNSQAETTFGWSKAEAMGRPLAELIIPKRHQEQHARGIQKYLETGAGPVLNRRIEIAALHRDGREFPVELTIWPLPAGSEIQFHAFIHDITERKEAEAEIRSKNQDLETLLYVTSHDLREPLRAIENFAKIVHDRYADRLDEKGCDFLDRVVRGAQRLDRLLEDVLTLSRVQRTTQLEEAVDCAELASEVLRRLEGRIRETSAVVRVDRDLPKLRLDRRWATQALYNLVGNALKYTQEGEPPDVEIAGYDGPEGAGLVVRDRGPGVPQEYAERIFQLFQRAVSRKIEGTGAGLAIVKRVAERHGGRAWVRGREGGGSEFIITFGASGAA